MTTRKKYWFILIFICLSAIVSGQKPTTSEMELQKRADKLYSSGNFTEAAPVYSQLLSLFPHDVLYNYRYGSSLVEASKEKTPAIVYLEFASKNSLVPEDVWWYLGKAYMQKNNFSAASSAFEKFKSITNPSKAKKMEVELLISNCKNANEVSKNRKDIAILSSREIKKAGFYTAYDYSETSGKLVPAADQFLSSLDKSKTKNPLMFISKDGQNIYYSSYGKGGNTGKDIYQIRKMVNGQWGLPENLGTVINSVEDEEYPYLDRDGKTLYFSSRGHTSMGGYDLFKSVFNYNTGQWSVPENMGVPINTASDEFFFVPTINGEQASYCTNFESNQDEVIFRNISLAGVNNRFAIITGTYFSLDQATRRDARISVVRSSDNAVVNSVRTDPKSGKYELVLPPGNDYTLIVEGGGYVTHAEEFSLPDLAVSGMRQEIKLNKDKEREQMTVSNFFTPVSIKDNEKTLAFKNTPTNVSTSSILNAGEDSTNLIPVRLNDEIVYIKDPKANKSEHETLIPGKAVNVATYGYTEDQKAKNHEVEVDDIAARKGLPTISLEEKDRYDPTLEAKMDSDELRQIEEEKERAQIIEEEEKNPTVLIDFNIDNDELAQIALDDAESLQEEAERMKERAQSMKANAILSDSLSMSLIAEAESLPKSETDKKIELKSRATELKEESISLNRQASDLLLQASIKLDESRSARKDADAILVSSGRGPSLASNPSKQSINTKAASKNNSLSRQEEISANNANLASGKEDVVDQDLKANSEDKIAKEELANSQNIGSNSGTINPGSDIDENASTANETSNSVNQDSENKLAAKTTISNTSTENAAANVATTGISKNTKEEAKKASTVSPNSGTNQELENPTTSTTTTNQKGPDNSTADSRGIAGNDSNTGSALNTEQVTEQTPIKSSSGKNVSSGGTADTQVNNSSSEKNHSDSQIALNKINENNVNPVSGNYNESTSVVTRTTKDVNSSEIAMSHDQTEKQSGNESQIKEAAKPSLNITDANSEKDNGVSSKSGLNENSSNENYAVSNPEVSGNQIESKLSVDNNAKKKNGEIESFMDSSSPEKNKTEITDVSVKENQTAIQRSTSEGVENATVQENNSKPISNDESIAAARESLKRNIPVNDNLDSGSNANDENSASEVATNVQSNLNTSDNAADKQVPDSSKVIPQNATGTSDESRSLAGTEGQNISKNQSDEKEVKSANNLASDQKVAVNSSTANNTGPENSVRTESKTVQTSVAAVPIREKYILAESERSQIDPETKIVFESYENNLKISEKLFVQSRALQDRVLAMPKSPERDSLLQVSNALSRESGSQYNLAQSQLEDAMQMDSSLSEKLQYTKAPVITSGSNLAENTQQNHPDLRNQLVSSEESKAGQSSNNLQANETSQLSSPSEENEIAQSTNSRPDPEVLNSKIATVPQTKGNLPVKSSVANPNEPLRRAGEENAIQTKTTDESSETSDQNKGSLSMNESPNTLVEEGNTLNNTVSVPSTKSASETRESTKKIFATAPVISKAERIEIATSEGLDVNHPKYPAYEKAQENVTKEQVNTINLFAEGVNLNKLSVEEKQQQVDLLDSAQNISDESLRNDILKQAELLGQSSERNQALSKEKFSASQRKTSEVKSLSSEMESLKAEIKMDPSGTSSYQSADISNPADKAETQITGANIKSRDEKLASGKFPQVTENSFSSGTNTETANSVSSRTVDNEISNAAATKELEALALKMYSKSGGPAYSELNPIPLNPGLPEGLVFKVQVGAFRKPIPDNSFKNLQPVTAETTRPGWLRYCVGLFKTFEPANLVKRELRGTGYKDAFVVAYLNGKRISLQEANAMLNQQDNQTAYNGEMQKEIAILQQLNVIPTASMSGVKDNDEELFYGSSPKPITVIEQAIGELEYSVQVGVYRTANPPVILNSLEPIYTEALSKGLYRFTSGRYPERADAETAKDRAIGVGISDAFVVAVRGTKSVSLPPITRNAVKPQKEVPFIASTEPVKSEVSADITTSSVPQTGLRFKVQLGAFKQNVPFETVETFLKISDKGIVRLTDERGLNIFYAGDFDNIESARLLREEIVGKGVTDAFVVVLSNGKRIPLSSVLTKEE